MPTPAYMWLNDGDIEGSVVIGGREGSIELFEYTHTLHIPSDVQTGRLTGVRAHSHFVVTKAVDRSSPLLFKALCEGQTLDTVEIRLYEIDDTGTEVEKYKVLLERVKVAKIDSIMPHTKDPSKEQFVQQEKVGFAYGRITWTFVDGQIEHTDDWEAQR